jgi:tellurium resistance protein TerZ
MTFVFKQNGEKTLNDLGGSSPILVFAIGWDCKAKAGLLGKLVGAKRQADLDLSCALYDSNGDRTDCVWYAQLSSKDGAIRHRGDDTVGADLGDDEMMIIDMNQLDDEIENLFFVISSFSEEGLSNVANGHWRLFDAQTKREIARYNFTGQTGATAKIVMRLSKNTTKGVPDWKIKAFDKAASGQNIQEVFPEIRVLIEG